MEAGPYLPAASPTTAWTLATPAPSRSSGASSRRRRRGGSNGSAGWYSEIFNQLIGERTEIDFVAQPFPNFFGQQFNGCDGWLQTQGFRRVVVPTEACHKGIQVSTGSTALRVCFDHVEEF